MNEMGASVGLGKAAGGARRKFVRAVLGLVLLIGVLVAVEAGSAYVLYRHYAALHRAFYPIGSAAVALAQAMKARADGRHEQVDRSSDRGPLFRSDPILGYTMFPGRFHITETQGGLRHRFSLTVDELGHRVTAYRPTAAARRIYITGDSAMFGWGLDDEQTIPWLLQARYPQFEVVDLSLSSYSTIQAMLQLDRTVPVVSADDIVVLTYHPITNEFNVASAGMLYYLEIGFERQLGDAGLLRDMTVPYASIGADDALSIQHYAVSCVLRKSRVGACDHPPVSSGAAMQVTMRTFDRLMAAHPGHYVVAFLNGEDSDPVIAHLKAKGATIADLRTDPAAPDANDEVSIDGHAGPFWHYNSAERLAETLHAAHWVD